LTKCKKKIKGFAFKKQGFDVAQNLCNDLETVTASNYPEIVSAKKALLDQGAMGALMSGSGPTVFGIFSDEHRARKAKLSLSINKRWTLYLVKIIA
jgi:4-diphosphocytidyl-2-C-methyl-D-erythritol kinase